MLLPRLTLSPRPLSAPVWRERGLLPRVLLLSVLLHVWLALSVGLRTGPADPARSGRGGVMVMVLEGWGRAPNGAAEPEVPELRPDGPPGTAPTQRHGGVLRPALTPPEELPGARRQGRWKAQELPPDPSWPEVDSDGAQGTGAMEAPKPDAPSPPPVAPRLIAPTAPALTTPRLAMPEAPRLTGPDAIAPVPPLPQRAEPPPGPPDRSTPPTPAPVQEAPVPVPEPPAPNPEAPQEPVLRVLTPDAPRVRERAPALARALGPAQRAALESTLLNAPVAPLRAPQVEAEAAATPPEPPASAASAPPAPPAPRWLEAPAPARARSTVERVQALGLQAPQAAQLAAPPRLPPVEPEPVLRTLDAPSPRARPVLEALRQPKLEGAPAPSLALPPAVPRLERPLEPLEAAPAPATVAAPVAPVATPIVPQVVSPFSSPVTPPSLQPPAGATPAAPPPQPGTASTRGDALPQSVPGPRASPGAPDAGPRVGHDVATAPSAAASSAPPPLNLSLPRASAAGPRRSPGLLELLPALPPERKNKMEKAVEDAQREDCRKAHQEKGLLALGPMALEALRNKGCKW